MKEVIIVWKRSTPLQAIVFLEESEATGRNSSVSTLMTPISKSFFGRMVLKVLNITCS
ncbi:hypothetical protein Nmel_001405 [Mimus melanotis]